MFNTHGHEVMHGPLTLWPKGPLSQCLQKAYRVDGLQLVLTYSFLKLVAEQPFAPATLRRDNSRNHSGLRRWSDNGFGNTQVRKFSTDLGCQ